MKTYKLLKNNKTIISRVPGEYAGWQPGKIFGTLDCKSGMRMKKENLVFFATLGDAVTEGYRPCRNCRPINEQDFERIRYLVRQYKTMEDFYRRE